MHTGSKEDLPTDELESRDRRRTRVFDFFHI